MPRTRTRLLGVSAFGVAGAVALSACSGDNSGGVGQQSGAGTGGAAGSGASTTRAGTGGAASGAAGALAMNGGKSGAPNGEPGATGGGGTTTQSGAGNANNAGVAGSSGLAGGGSGQGGAAGTAGMGGVMSSGGVGSAGNAGQTSTGGAAGAPATCTSSTLMAGNSNRTVMVGGTARTFILHVPSGYTGKTRVPLVLDFHGLGGSGMQQQSSSGFQAVADKEGFLILYPNGIDNAWNIGPCCTNSRDVDDLGFAKAMVTDISAAGCVDPTRVYATGFSMGGGMSHYLACNAADVFAATSPASFDLLVPEEEACEPSRPIAVMATRGTADTVVPFAGGKGSSGRVTFLGAEGSFERWAMIDGCMGATTTDGDCTFYEQCSAGVEVGLCVKQGGSHAPGDANQQWAFLSKFTLPH